MFKVISTMVLLGSLPSTAITALLLVEQGATPLEVALCCLSGVLSTALAYERAR